MTNTYEDITYKSSDGLTLYARDYAGPVGAPTILCMHGLTRNSADFHWLAEHLQDRYRVISVDQRGRGRSEYDSDPANYQPGIYCQDMFTLLNTLNLTSVIAIGTSMGGLMTMMMAALRPGIFSAAIINDIGPEIDPAGLERIRGYIGGDRRFQSWEEAVEAVKAQGPDVFPDYDEKDWEAFARRVCEEVETGDVRFAYDPALSGGVKTQDENVVPPNLWPQFAALHGCPVLVIRGEMSDILAPATVENMCQEHPNCTAQVIPRVGHAPMLDEPDAITAIDMFLRKNG